MQYEYMNYDTAPDKASPEGLLRYATVLYSVLYSGGHTGNSNQLVSIPSQPRLTLMTTSPSPTAAETLFHTYFVTSSTSRSPTLSFTWTMTLTLRRVFPASFSIRVVVVLDLRGRGGNDETTGLEGTLGAESTESDRL